MFAAVPSAAPSLSERFGSIIAGLRRDLAVRAARDRVVAAFAVLLWNRIGAIARRFAAIVDRHAAGRLRRPPQPRRRPATTPSATPATPPRPPPRRQTPSWRRAWLRRLMPECGARGQYLRLLLAEPEMVRLIEAAPQLRRLIRPLWRMLHSDPPPDILRAPRPAGKPSPSPSRKRAGVRVPAKPSMSRAKLPAKPRPPPDIRSPAKSRT